MGEIISINAIATTNQLSELYFKWLKYAEVKGTSRRTYENAIKQFLGYLAESGTAAPTRDTIASWRDSLAATKKPSTVATYLTAVKVFFSWLEDEGLYKNIAKRVKCPKITSGHKKDYLNAEQCKSVLAAIDREGERGLRNYAIISLMLTTGLRDIEIARADLNDLATLNGEPVLYIQGKGRDERNEFVKLAQPVYKALADYLTARGAETSEPLFTGTSNNGRGQRLTTRTVSSIAKKALQAAGYDSERLTAHSLRHTAATMALRNGAELTQVQQLLRHSNINTTMIYVHELEREANNCEQLVANAIF